jgi:hypothetical protein
MVVTYHAMLGAIVPCQLLLELAEKIAIAKHKCPVSTIDAVICFAMKIQVFELI